MLHEDGGQRFAFAHPTRPRNDPRYGKIVYGIWGYLKDEVERARL